MTIGVAVSTAGGALRQSVGQCPDIQRWQNRAGTGGHFARTGAVIRRVGGLRTGDSGVLHSAVAAFGALFFFFFFAGTFNGNTALVNIWSSRATVKLLSHVMCSGVNFSK